MRYRRRRRLDEASLRERLRTLAGERPRWGYRRLHVLLRRELGGRGGINHKRVYRLYREEGTLRRRKRKRVAIAPRGLQEAIWKRGEAWAMDFMQDVFGDERGFPTLNVLDAANRECLALEVDTSLPGLRVARVLDQLVASHGIPKQITVDNGPEFAGRTLDAWAYAHGVVLDFHRAGQTDAKRPH